MSSVFTPSGTNAAEGQQDQEHTAAGKSATLLNAYTPLVNNQISYDQSQQPVAQNAVSQLGQFTTQAGRDQRTNTYAQNARGQAQAANAQTLGQFAGNAALGQAYQLGNMNQANQATNQYSQQLNSPAGEQQAYGTYLQGLQSQAPDFQGISQLTSNIFGQPKVQVGQGLLGTLGGLAGSYLAS